MCIRKSIKEKTDDSYYPKIKNFDTTKITQIVKRQASHCEKCITDNGLISKIHKEPLQIKEKKK